MHLTVIGLRALGEHLTVPTVTENDIKELKELITAGFKDLSDGINQLKVSVGQIGTKISGLDKRMDFLGSRVNRLTGWLIGVLFALVGRIIGKSWHYFGLS